MTTDTKPQPFFNQYCRKMYISMYSYTCDYGQKTELLINQKIKRVQGVIKFTMLTWQTKQSPLSFVHSYLPDACIH